jgi:hypothetical protein
MIIHWHVSKEAAVRLAQVLSSAEHEKRNVRTDHEHEDNAPFYELNALGEALARRLEHVGVKVWDDA